ncbi:hypothetical protein COCSUDRAFT_33982 [Coccomyxa subellipsoidea C-169]|uniref:Uncharacterized protein n=1 Tax=Coccomyxa subellipsoidea (strain C-169) TaxID=574566 RepID=I0YQ05_COCSC|nr:hypothetical protein COCSUDRAFT_33982 [Coccomyxa subellipsoidea C-169]EIE20474.1 hypothetical protein COCSUDRAFT_33982 [Coccomyxa subellipsoidea C-169]|eukprot:XP_005645018.1 hypothetical protein COCSUDRAFT_33982 [Coccomyxa subellipsoidea C-169]
MTWLWPLRIPATVLGIFSTHYENKHLSCGSVGIICTLKSNSVRASEKAAYCSKTLYAHQ